MERILACLFLAGTVPAVVVAVRTSMSAGVSWVFGAFLIVAALPAVLSFWATVRRRARLASGVAALAAGVIGVLAIALVRGRPQSSWRLAVTLGFIAFFGVIMLLRRRVVRVEAALRRANGLFSQKQFDIRAVLAALEEAEAALDDQTSIQQRALFEWLSAATQARLHNLGRANTHAQEALTLYRRLRRPTDVGAVEGFIAQIGGKTGRPSGAPDLMQTTAYSRLLAASGLMVVAAAAVLFRMWAPPWAQFSVRALVACAVTLSVWFVTLPWFLSKSTRPVRAVLGLALFSVSGLGAWFAFAAAVLARRTATVAELAAPLHDHAEAVLQWLSAQPSSIPFVALGVCVGLAVLSFILLKGEAIGKLMEAAARELRANQWERAIAILESCNLGRERDPDVKASALFALSFAHHMSSAVAEAKRWLTELLEGAPQHREGLYLAGYLAFEADEIEQAETFWRRLHQLDPDYCPPEGGPEKTVRRYLCLALYRKAAQMMAAEPEIGVKILAEIGELGAMDQSLSGTLVGVYCQRAAEHMRARNWQAAGKELDLGKDKLRHFKGTDNEGRDKKKLEALCEAGLGLVAMKLNKHGIAAKHLLSARAMVKDLLGDEQLLGGEDDLLAQLLRAASRKRKSAGSIAPVFARDASFIAGLAQLNGLREQVEQRATCDWRSALTVAQRSFQESLEVSPEFVDATAMLGLLYCYGDATAAGRAKGLELLRKICERSGSKFVAKTVAQEDAADKDRGQARDSYLQALQQYLRSASVPRTERVKLRDEVLDRMRAFGQEKSFVGRGSLDVNDDREHEPTVKEYIARAAMLRDKLLKLTTGAEGGSLSDQIRLLVEKLGEKSEELAKHARSVAETEKEIMQKAQTLLFN
jgi:hypothetical protein